MPYNGSPAFHCSPVLGGIVESWSYPLVAERPCGNSLRGPVDPQGAERLADQRFGGCFQWIPLLYYLIKIINFNILIIMKKALRFKPLKQPPVMARFIYLFITIFLWFWAIVGIIMVGIAILEMLGLIKLNRPIL